METWSTVPHNTQRNKARHNCSQAISQLFIFPTQSGVTGVSPSDQPRTVSNTLSQHNNPTSAPGNARHQLHDQGDPGIAVGIKGWAAGEVVVLGFSDHLPRFAVAAPLLRVRATRKHWLRIKTSRRWGLPCGVKWDTYLSTYMEVDVNQLPRKYGKSYRKKKWFCKMEEATQHALLSAPFLVSSKHPLTEELLQDLVNLAFKQAEEEIKAPKGCWVENFLLLLVAEGFIHEHLVQRWRKVNKVRQPWRVGQLARR